MKSQDIGILLKLVCLQKREQGSYSAIENIRWEDWELTNRDDPEIAVALQDYFHPASKNNLQIISQYAVRSLAHSTGISKSQVNLSLQRSLNVGLARRDREMNIPRTNQKALLDFILSGIRYVFPAKPGNITRGITTSLAAPVFKNKLFSAGELNPVWPDAKGSTKGQLIEPLFKSVTYAVRRDPDLYVLLALVDAIRIGQPRERNLATELLHQHLQNKL